MIFTGCKNHCQTTHLTAELLIATERTIRWLILNEFKKVHTKRNDLILLAVIFKEDRVVAFMPVKDQKTIGTI
jgi:hypothetical protein